MWVIAVAAVLLIAACTLAATGRARAARQKAAAAADLAALTGARYAARGHGDACRAAARVARANRARLTGCTVRGRIVRVRTSVPVRVLPGARLAAAARARAGPAETSADGPAPCRASSCGDRGRRPP